MKNTILDALRSDDLTRADIIRSWINSGIIKGAPQNFNDALFYLLQKEIAKEVIQLLTD